MQLPPPSSATSSSVPVPWCCQNYGSQHSRYYCNALFYGVTQSTINKLQRVQNNLARVVCDVGWHQAHSADLLCDLHWLPYASGWCSRRCHCSGNQPTFHFHHKYQPVTSDQLTPTSWTNHQPGLLSVSDASVTTCHTSGTLFRWLSDPLTITTPSRPG